MLQKSARMGASMVLSRTSPSSLSIQLAEQQGITLVGYTRRDGFYVYTHPYRIQSSQTGCEIYSQLTTGPNEIH
jgi:FdhD protein